MTDLLIRLYDLPASDAAALAAVHGVELRRALPPERRLVVDWIATHFIDLWASECEVAFSSLPVTTWIAFRGGDLLGFACHDATAKGFFGPTGVVEAERGRGIGEALLFATLVGMREAGYAYAVVGGAGPTGFYKKRLEAVEIPGSDPGLYRGLLRRPSARP